MHTYTVEVLPAGEYGVLLSAHSLYASAAALAAVSALLALAATLINKRVRDL